MSGETRHHEAASNQAPVPPDCFRLEELEQLQSIEGQTLVGLNYYIWLPAAPFEQTQNRGFLYFLELIFEGHDPLFLTSGEDSSAIRVSDAASLLHTATQLQALHGRASIQRLQADTSPLWQPLIGKTLTAIHLPRHESGLYANAALELDFGGSQIVVQLAQKEGLEIIG